MKKPIIELVLLLFSFALGFAPSGAQEKNSKGFESAVARWERRR
jgi:hypothetical protein